MFGRPFNEVTGAGLPSMHGDDDVVSGSDSSHLQLKNVVMISAGRKSRRLRQLLSIQSNR